jgi:hypothetical protein
MPRHDGNENAESALRTPAAQLADEGREQVRRVGRIARDRALQMAGERKQDLADRLDERGAETLHRLSDALRTRQPEELLDEVESAIRRNPVAVMVACVGAGFVVARLLKA